jgi:hypothetical protein
MPPDRDLERELRDLGPRLEYPPVPDLARSVRDRLESEGEGTGSTTRARPQLWWIAAAALVLLVAVPVVTLALRDTGGVSSLGGGAAGGVAESGGPTRLAEDAAGPTHSSGDDGSLADEAVGGPDSSKAAGSGASAEAACGWPKPSLEARPTRGAPGEGLGIRGRYFEADVRDCDLDPARHVRVDFLQDGRTWELGTVEASKGSRIFASLKVPADARPGRATVRATYEQRTPEDPHGKTSVEARFFVTE